MQTSPACAAGRDRFQLRGAGTEAVAPAGRWGSWRDCTFSAAAAPPLLHAWATTWAPKGKTPELIASARHDCVSVISTATVSARAHRVSFVRRVQHTARRPVTFAWSRIPAHAGGFHFNILNIQAV
jgi:hypothetical protein